MSNLCSRLKDFFTFMNINLSNVEVDCGFGKNTLRKSFDRGSNIGSDKLEVILNRYPNLSAEWLLRGNGNMLLADEEKPQQAQNVGDWGGLAFALNKIGNDCKALQAENDRLKMQLTQKEKAVV